MSSHRELANAIRALSMDAVERAGSGHPGMPLGMADIAEVLWNHWLVHNPANPGWDNRDRFVLSNGHGSMLLYALLHLTGYDLPLDELRQFRQLGSRTPGHPEYGVTPGVETTTGPLGQGIANAVGMALAERVLAATYNRPGFPIVDHHTYVFLGDGCLMEGISHEACSLAGTLGLGKLIALYDDNGISIDGEVRGWFTDNTEKRFRAYGWHVIDGVDGHDAAAINRALEVAREVGDKPTLIICRTVIGYGSPAKQGSETAHGAPLGAEEVAAVRQRLGWHHPPFEIPDSIRAGFDARERGADHEARWQRTFEDYRRQHPALAAEYQRRMRGDLPEDWSERVNDYVASCNARGADMATRKASLAALEAYGPALPELLGGSADLAGSNLTIWSGSRTVDARDPAGNYVYFGVREFAMTAIAGGLALHGGFIPYTATFLTFSDYARNAVRMSALMGLRSLLVYTHDSIGVGEDGPTHQPVEHVASLRLIPGLSVWRPADAVESAVAWAAAIERSDGPTALIFTRQTVPHQPRTPVQLDAIRRGGYVLRDCDGTPDVLLIATGSEVGIAVEAARELTGEGVAVRVVSLPSTDVFEAQPSQWRDQVLPPAVHHRVVVEAGVTDGWAGYAGPDGQVIGLDRYGESAPGKAVFEHFGFTATAVAQRARELLGRAPQS
jgi:transketolase